MDHLSVEATQQVHRSRSRRNKAVLALLVAFIAGVFALGVLHIQSETRSSTTQFQTR